jgi:hypothetical protein
MINSGGASNCRVGQGEFFIVPKGIEHLPDCRTGSSRGLESESPLNTGNERRYNISFSVHTEDGSERTRGESDLQERGGAVRRQRTIVDRANGTQSAPEREVVSPEVQHLRDPNLGQNLMGTSDQLCAAEIVATWLKIHCDGYAARPSRPGKES